ncbi:T5orf172 domain-containing protein [Aspergillus granulosus]|uniref:T5orf172 domain-containing protein n=1 Tax=Aspergillus granulosus TaxID=176169 RepID=A0ABR4HIT7_9EURO
MRSSTDTDDRTIISDAIPPTTGKILSDALPTFASVDFGGPAPLLTLAHKGKHIQPKEEARKNIQALKVRLNCEQTKCGSHTKTTGKPCRVSLKTHEIVAANAMIESLIHLTQSSANLEDELSKLANIVHCRHHADRASVQRRVSDWIMAFPIGDGKAIPVISVAKQIGDILSNGASNRCLGNTIKGRRCQRGIGGQKVLNYQKTINEIVKPDTYLDDSELDFFLQVLRHNSFCYYHIRYQGAERVTNWRLMITNLRSKESIPSAGSDVFRTSKGDSQLASTASLHMGISIPSIVRRHSKSVSPDRYWPKAYDNSPFEIVTGPVDTDDHGSSFPEIQRSLCAPLNEKDQTKGYVYAYEVEGNKGFVKIGYTTKTVEERHNEWTFECNRLVLPIYPIDLHAAVAVPNVARVEALCHAELRHCHIRIYCPACLKQHIEWFQVSSAEAIALIQKWSNWMWMQSLPYQSSVDLASDTLALIKDEEKPAIDFKTSCGRNISTAAGYTRKLDDPAPLKQ